MSSIEGTRLTTTIPRSAANLGVGAAAVTAQRIGHTFDNGFRALAPTDLHVDAGSFCTLLGPSGSGKTTVLRILAGLLTPSEGRVLIGGHDVTNEPVQKRDIGFVFQHYALFPHMTVAQNIAYPLRIRGASKQEQATRVDTVLELISLQAQKDLRPDQLSGGQQQRVAIGRALVYGPKVLLLDEPLGALDRRLRQQLGSELRRIQQETGTTAIYVTHDQDEAFLLSDKVVVMNHGHVRQQGAPEHIYASPIDIFVARFVGDTNLIRGVARRTCEGAALHVGNQVVNCRAASAVNDTQPAALSVRPEDVRLAPIGTPYNGFVFGQGVVIDRVFLGARYRTMVQVGDYQFAVESGRDDYAPLSGTIVQVGWADGLPVLLNAPD
ncbi:ABC transporter ATP-binding protein [Mesorhizobium sp. M0029]|uniref:ABC transporter ATP-binding protein n=1 Tax=Mesorhizobium sp. M0029 TaxID=2956850 RepID=UPI00333577E2